MVSDRPVMLVRVCGHAAVLNTRTMELTGLLNAVDRDVIRDERGNATGVIIEQALDRVTSYRSMRRQAGCFHWL
ncbi:hypothetical protein JCM16161A_05870 [Vulcanisaeta sp. JCM 16161]|uniref:hypothetical protein n=1 Tax=Vulcanisaeta sp. JCM 16161 TaxID=1295372 RepID=UPI000ACE1CDE